MLLIDLMKLEIVVCGFEFGVDYGKMIFCYDLDEQGCVCGECDVCLLRFCGFVQQGIDDLVVYC